MTSRRERHYPRAGRRINQIEGQFSHYLIEMLEHPSFRVLSRAAHQVLARICIEQAQHGGNDNGRLPVTYDQFEEYGIHRKSIAPAIRELAALGFIHFRPGQGGNAEFARAGLFGLTWRPTATLMSEQELATVEAHNQTQRWSQRTPVNTEPSHEWRRRCSTMAEAERIAAEARATKKKLRASRRNKNPVAKSTLAPVVEFTTGKRQSPVVNSTTTVGAKSTTTSISRGGGRSGGGDMTSTVDADRRHASTNRDSVANRSPAWTAVAVDHAASRSTDSDRPIMRRRLSRRRISSS